MCATSECADCSVLADIDIDDATRDAHIDCLECGAEGCRGCPAGSLCDLPRLIEHAGEHMCPGCVGAFEVMTDNAAEAR